LSRKIVLIILGLLAVFMLSSCSLALDRNPDVSNPMDEFVNKPRLKGYVISFRSYIDGVELNMELDSNNPFMLYENINNSLGESYVEYIQGNAIFMPSIKHDASDDMRSIELETYIILGPKFNNTIMDIQQVLVDPITNELSLNDFSYGYMLSYPNIGLKISQQAEYKENDLVIDAFKFEIDVRFVDTLLSVDILEYDKDNIFLKSTIYESFGNYDLDTLENTEYIIIEEEYLNKDEETYIKRTIYSRGENYNNTFYFLLMFTNEIGYVENNKSIKIIFT